ncbi:MAG: hypothetical protein JSV91_02290 [Phycisphaerales bacterium]|nr:MAG: hypothetical protein JSV91_02290 [Phycisphaerales bacterium]
MRTAAALLMVWLTVLLTACSTAQVHSGDPLDPAPPDFSLEAVVLVGKDVEKRTETHLAPARFVLFADGSLHYAPENADRAAGGMGYRRTLNRRQVAGLWSQLQQLGLADPARGDEIVNFNLVTPPAEEIAYLLAVTGGGDRWVFIRSRTEGDPADAAITAVICHLADLAWVSDLREENIPRRAKRYDLGPDPYARYRGP